MCHLHESQRWGTLLERPILVSDASDFGSRLWSGVTDDYDEARDGAPQLESSQASPAKLVIVLSLLSVSRLSYRSGGLPS